jgi:hypothetical protein
MSSIAGLVTDVDGMQSFFGEGTKAMGEAQRMLGPNSPAAHRFRTDDGWLRTLEISWNPDSLPQWDPVALLQVSPNSGVPAGFTAPLSGTGKIAAPPGACPAGAKAEAVSKTGGGETVTAGLLSTKNLRAISQRYIVDPPPSKSLMAHMEGLVKPGDPRLTTSKGWNEVLWKQMESLQTPSESLMDYQIWTVSPAIEEEVVGSFLKRLNSLGLPPMIINVFKGSDTSGWMASRVPTADDMLARMEIEAELSGSLEGTVYERRDVSIPAPRTRPIFGPQTGNGKVIWNHPTEGKIPFEVDILLNEFDDQGRAIAGIVKGGSKESDYEFAIQFKKDGTKEGELFRNGANVGKLAMTVDAEKFHNYLNLETNQEEQLTKPNQ